MSSNEETRKKVEALVEALDDAPIDERDARDTVKRLGIDVKAMAAGIREKIAAADAKDTKSRIDEATAAYAREIERLERRKAEPKRSRDEQLVVFQALLARAPTQAVAMHFHKYESASDDELAELIRSLRHLLGEDEPDE